MSSESPLSDPRLLKSRLEMVAEQFKLIEERLQTMSEDLAIIQEQLYELVKASSMPRKPK